MKYKSNFDYPPRSGKIVGFASASSDYLELIRKDIGLSMPLSALSTLQNYARLNFISDPYVSELVFFDILRENSAPGEALLAEFETDDRETAETFSDLTEKLHALYPRGIGAVPFSVLFSAAEEYFFACLPFTESKTRILFDCDFCRPTLVREYMSDILRFLTDDGDFSFYLARESFIKEKKPKKKCCYYLICGENGTIASKTALGTFAADSELARTVYSARYAGDSAVSAILADSENALIDLSSFVQVSDDISLMAELGRGGLILTASADSQCLLSDIAGKYGLFAYRIGEKRRKGGIELRMAESRVFHADFLRKFLCISGFEAVSIRLCAKKGAEAVIRKLKCVPSGNENVLFNTKVSCLESDFSVSPYRCGEALAIDAAAEAVASGIKPQDARPAFCVFASDENREETLAFILGFYRARVELCLASCGDRLITERKGLQRAYAVMNMPFRRKTPDSGQIFAVLPEDGDSPSAKYSALRRVFDYISALLSEDENCALFSAGGEKATEKFLHGAFPSHSFTLSDKACETLPHGSFVVLTAGQLSSSGGVNIRRLGFADIAHVENEI